MKLKKYLDDLNNLIKDYPELLDSVVVYARDSEGNGFEENVFSVTKGYFDKENKEFSTNAEDLGTDSFEEAVCVN